MSNNRSGKINEYGGLLFAIEIVVGLVFAMWIAVALHSLEYNNSLAAMFAFYCAYITGEDVLF